MLVSKIAPIFLLVLAVGAEKKIELQDIEDDNLKSEKESKLEKDEGRQAVGFGSGQGIFSLEFLKNNLPKYFSNPSPAQQPRYVQQYAVTEQPELAPTAEATVSSPKSHYGPPPTPQQAMVGYLSNVPMQIYLVPQYYNHNEQTEQAASPQASVKYATPAAGHVTGYPTTPEEVQQQNNYIEVPAYIAPSGAAYIQQYSSPAFHYVTYAHPTIAPVQSTVSPLVYQMPAIHYPSAIAAPPVVEKGHQYHQYFTETNTVEDTAQDEVESPKQYVKQTDSPYEYVAQTESPYQKQRVPEILRYYNSRAPYREEHRQNPVSELPPPNPILLKSPPSHLSHLPKALPMYRPLTKPVYATGGNLLTNAYTPRPSESYGAPPFKRRPNSLLDSYIPSGVQLQYLKRGYIKDPLQAYEALSSGRQFSSPSGGPRHYERGFLPNQMYHTGAGGVLYGHYKRTPKGEKVPQGPQKK